jgi:hypothetical protein
MLAEVASLCNTRCPHLSRAGSITSFLLLLCCRRFLLLLSGGVARLWLQLVGGAGQHQGVAWSGGATLLVDGHTQVALTGETLGVWVTGRVLAHRTVSAADMNCRCCPLLSRWLCLHVLTS